MLKVFRPRLYFAFEIGVLIFSVCAGPVHAEQPAGAAPVCIGYDPVRKHWGYVGNPESGADENCPPGYAMMAHSWMGTGPGKTSLAFVSGSCCPLPPGALTEEHRYDETNCPDGFVVTGARVDPPAVKDAPGTKQDDSQRIVPTFWLRCTRVDSSRWTLGPPTKGWRMGFPRELFSETRQTITKGVTRVTTRARVPAALRYGLLRPNHYRWDIGGCIGYPFGSLLVAREGRRCGDLLYRELRDRAGKADVFARCSALTSPFDENARCRD